MVSDLWGRWFRVASGILIRIIHQSDVSKRNYRSYRLICNLLDGLELKEKEWSEFLTEDFLSNFLLEVS